MFLALTGDQRFWNYNDDVLFLGEWCKIYSQKESWGCLKSRTLQYHWDNRDQYHSDIVYLDMLYEKYLNLLAVELNKILGVNHNADYWRIIVGPWLIQFIDILYDRYLTLISAKNSGLVTDVWICDTEKNRVVVSDLKELQVLITYDEYNLYLFSRLIELLDLFHHVKKGHSLQILQENNSFSKGELLKYKLYFLYEKILANKVNSVFFISSKISNIDLLKINLKLKQLPHFGVLLLRDIPNVAINDECRQKIKFPQSNVKFESILAIMIPELIPTCFIENYHVINKMAMKIFPKSPKVIFTANGYGDVFFTFWIASMKERGTHLIGTQQSGGYGSSLLLPSEVHQIKICDKYLTWGWNNASHPTVYPFASGKLASAKREINSNNKGNIIIIGDTLTRYFDYMLCCPFSGSFVSYINEQHTLYSLLSENVRKILRIRLRPNSLCTGWDEEQRWHDLDPNIIIDNGGKSYYEQLNESRLSIHTMNGTTYLEAFAANFPAIIFWNPKYSEIRSEAQPFFDMLHDVGILHYTPESAAALINEIYEDPMKWWMQPHIQKAKDEFCYQFARTSDDWIDQFADIMKKELAEVNAEQKVNKSLFERLRRPKGGHK